MEGLRMTKCKTILGLVALGATMAVASASQASTVTVTYTTITSNDPDVGNSGTSPYVLSTLGPDGLPVEATPGEYNDVNNVGELLWWTPHGNDVTAGTT